MKKKLFLICFALLAVSLVLKAGDGNTPFYSASVQVGDGDDDDDDPVYFPPIRPYAASSSISPVQYTLSTIIINCLQQNITVTVYNAAGNTVYQTVVANGYTTINTANWSKGIYSVVLSIE